MFENTLLVAVLEVLFVFLSCNFSLAWLQGR
jgi:hypothetical protein